MLLCRSVRVSVRVRFLSGGPFPLCFARMLLRIVGLRGHASQPAHDTVGFVFIPLSVRNLIVARHDRRLCLSSSLTIRGRRLPCLNDPSLADQITQKMSRNSWPRLVGL